MAGIGAHHSARMDSDEWLTPPYIIQSLLPFNLDPCAPIERPWDTAYNHLTKLEDGLSRNWLGTVWCNPPYGKQTAAWLEKLADHGDGIALIFARTETAMFHKWVWQRATSILFLEGRITFYKPDGTPGKHNSGGPSCLVSYGFTASQKLIHSDLPGHLVINSFTRRNP